MKNITLLLLLIVLSGSSYAQSNKEKALEKGHKAIELVDAGKYKEGIKLFEEAAKLDPENVNYPYEIAYAYYMQKDYKTAIPLLEKLTGHKDVTDNTYQLLGNAHDILGKSDKAMDIYKEGLKKFPNSGKLYLEQGVVQMKNDKFSDALSYFEQGIKAEPAYSSNYYWAAKLYCSSDEEIWGVLYGEIFMNIERGTKRTAEISKLLYDTYKSEIKVSDTTGNVSFSKVTVINSVNLEGGKFKPPFSTIYEMALVMSIVGLAT